MKYSRSVIAALLLAVIAGTSAHSGDITPPGLLPADNEISGWKLDGEPLIYGPQDLWEYIDGQAETFLMYDFREVAAQHYLDPSGLEIKVEIYEHGSPLMAFGIYSQFRSPDVEYLEIGNEAFGDEYSIHFWKGRFYVEIYAYEEGEKISEAMKEFAETVAGKIPDGGREPAEVFLFPRGGLIEKSVTFVNEGVMGSGKLPPAFTGDYSIGEEKGKLYIFPLESVDAAAEAFNWYTGEIGATAEEAGQEEAKYATAEGEAPYRGTVRVFSYGRFMGIVTGFGAGSSLAGDLADETVKLIRESGAGPE
jgi:hypothetical protein